MPPKGKILVSNKHQHACVLRPFWFWDQNRKHRGRKHKQINRLASTLQFPSVWKRSEPAAAKSASRGLFLGALVCVGEICASIHQHHRPIKVSATRAKIEQHRTRRRRVWVNSVREPRDLFLVHQVRPIKKRDEAQIRRRRWGRFYQPQWLLHKSHPVLKLCQVISRV